MSLDRSKRSAVFSDIAFGIAHKKDMDGAVAWLIRDPSVTPAALAVVQKEDLTDNVYVVARNLMRRDIQSQPTTNGRRVIKIYREQHVVISEGGVSRTAYFHMSLSNVTKSVAPEMLRRHDAAPKLDVAGLAEVRLVFAPTKDVASP